MNAPTDDIDALYDAYLCERYGSPELAAAAEMTVWDVIPESNPQVLASYCAAVEREEAEHAQLADESLPF